MYWNVYSKNQHLTPTPVSALIHAATMVTAGVYLLIRSSPLIEYSSTVLLLCLWLGAITTVFSSLVGLFQQDIKKVIAYSTMSQLGMMVIAIGLSSYNIALFHLVNHAFYKGLLFLGAGAVIHAVADNQDFRKYGGLITFLPLTYSVILIASLSLVAFPFMTGFYSKDLILESAFGQFSFSSIAVYVIATIGAIFTTLYSVKVLYLTFLANPNGSMQYYRHAHEGDIFLSLPLVILAMFSIFLGYITKDIFIGLGSNFFVDNAIFIHPTHEILLVTEFAVPTVFKLLPFVFTVSFSVLALLFSEFLPKSLINFKLSRLGYNIFGFFNQRFLVEMFYNKYITNLILNLGGQTTRVLDKGSIELIGPFGLEIGLLKLSKNISSLSTGVVTSYALYILAAFILYVTISYFLFTNSQSEVWALFILILFSVLSLFIYSNSLSKKTVGLIGLRSDYNQSTQLYSSMFFISRLGYKSFYIWSIRNLKRILLFFYFIIVLYVMVRFFMYSFDLFMFLDSIIHSNDSSENSNNYCFGVIGMVNESSLKEVSVACAEDKKISNDLFMDNDNTSGGSNSEDKDIFKLNQNQFKSKMAYWEAKMLNDEIKLKNKRIELLTGKDSLTEEDRKEIFELRSEKSHLARRKASILSDRRLFIGDRQEAEQNVINNNDNNSTDRETIESYKEPSKSGSSSAPGDKRTDASAEEQNISLKKRR